MKYFILLFFLACNPKAEVSNPNMNCADFRACGPDAICAPEESCFSVPGCEKTLCLNQQNVCETACGSSDCVVAESYPAQIQCP